MRASISRTWGDPQRRRRLLTLGVLVSAVVTLAHQALPGHGTAFWLPFHAALPAVVFSLGARAGGARRVDGRLLLRGVVVVGVVTLSFGMINAHPLPLPAAALLNLLVPLTVSTLGAATGAGEAGEDRESRPKESAEVPT